MDDALATDLETSRQKKRGQKVQKPIRRWFIFALIVAVLSIGAIIWTLNPSSSPESSSKEKSFEGPNKRYSVKYPAVWTKLDRSEKAKYDGAFSFAATRDDPTAFLGIREQPLEAGESDLKVVSSMMDKEMPKQFKDFEKISSKTQKLNCGEEALRYDFNFLSVDGQRVYEQIVVVPTATDVYYITTWADKNDDIDIVKVDLERVLEEFRIDQ